MAPPDHPSRVIVSVRSSHEVKVCVCRVSDDRLNVFIVKLRDSVNKCRDVISANDSHAGHCDTAVLSPHVLVRR